ncbi:hypothetical protein KX928_13305 [Roseobacter sp. YSTF-M11]|uniref:Uncharacterized protein n=1 Tax=Roseobacter insulae TaxID=2859783 RepID=A0A9X1FXC1_9RHOB|nr:hypothetical protein [Roseobacter insulae]MBW4708760.1 hypothetical protein [Roseobacter insulae]
MFNHVKKIALAATVSLTAIAASGVSAGEVVTDIDVQATIDAPQGSNALQLYPTIADDLSREILERVDTGNDPAGPVLTIKIKRVSLDGDTILPDSAEFNELEGFVSYQRGTKDIAEMIRLSAYSDEASVPAGYIAVPPSQDDFYNAMLTAFADRVVALLPEADS